MKELRAKAWSFYKNTALESWVVGLLTGLLITGLLCLDFVVPGINIIIFPFISLPILFAAYYSHLGVHLNQRLTFSSTMRYMFAYYRPPFNSSFGVLTSILKSLLVFLGTELVFSFFGVQLTYLINPGIEASIESFQNYLLESQFLMSYDDIMNLLIMNNNALLIYVYIVTLPAYILAIGFFIYNISRNSIGIYLRLNMAENDARYIKMVMATTNRVLPRKMFKSWMALNWPMIILYFVGAIGGAIGMVFLTKNPLIIMSGAIAGGVLLLAFYMPFYLPNMEAIYDTFSNAYRAGANKVNEMLKQTAIENAKRVQEEKEYFEKILHEMEEHVKEVEKEKEKDPSDGSE